MFNVFKQMLRFGSSLVKIFRTLVETHMITVATQRHKIHFISYI